MKTYSQLVAEQARQITEIYPWDLAERLRRGSACLLLDIREREEFDAARLAGSIHIPRGQLEAACEWGFAETVPELVEARNRPVVVICRSGNRSVLGAYTLKLLGFDYTSSLKTGIKGWNDADLPLIDAAGQPVDADEAEAILSPTVSPQQTPR